VSIKDHIGWAPLQQALILYWRIRDIWCPTNLLALMVAELDDNLPHFMDDRRDSDERLSPNLLRGRGKSIGGELDGDDEGSEQNVKPL
jgi:hypothetical protein